MPGPISALPVLTVRADATVTLIRETLAYYRRQELLFARWRRPAGRLTATPTVRSAAQQRAQAAHFRLTSLVESYTAVELVKRMEEHAPAPRKAILDAIYVVAEDRASGSWPDLETNYDGWLNIKFKEFADWPKVKAMTAVRNAIAHGLGTLTSRQTRKGTAKLVTSLKTIDVTTSGHTLAIPPRAVETAAGHAAEFVRWLDGKLVGYDSSH